MRGAGGQAQAGERGSTAHPTGQCACYKVQSKGLEAPEVREHDLTLLATWGR